MGTAFATQGHAEPEGLYVHQMSHLFFAFSMGLMIYWIRARNLSRQSGWKYIQYSALLFILWTLDAFTVHLLDEQWELVRVTRTGHWGMFLDTGGNHTLAVLYYIVKLDHLLCVPAMFLLYLGLKKLLAAPEENAS